MPYSYLDFYRAYDCPDVPEISDSTDKQWVSIKCPFHNDHTPSAAISMSTGGINCFVCGMKSPVDFLVEIAGLEPSEALIVIENIRSDNDLNVNFGNELQHKQPIYSRHFEKLYEDSQKYMSPDRYVVQEYMRTRGIQYQTLIDLGIGCLPKDATVWHEEVLVFPYMQNGHVIGLKYRDAGGNRGAEKDTFVCLSGLELFEETEDLTPITLIITEGETDRLRTYQALKNCNHTENIYVLGTPSCHWNNLWRRNIAGARILIIPQDDRQSAGLVNELRRNVPEVEVLPLKWTRKQQGKDICDYLRYHTEEEFVKEIEALLDTKKARKIMTFSEFADSVSEEREWLIEGFMSRNVIHALIGKAKHGKTWLALGMIRSLLTGENYLGIPQLKINADVENTKILFWEEEGADAEILERLNLVLQGIPKEDLDRQLFIAHQLGVKLDQDTDIDLISKFITDHDGIDLVIFDPFSRLFTADEDNASEMAAVWSRVASLQNRHKRTSFLILHHTNKSSSIETSGLEGSRGSSRFSAEIDGGIMVEKIEEKNKITLETSRYLKCKFDGRFAPIETPDGDSIFKLVFDPGTGLYHPMNTTPTPRGRGSKLYRLLEDYEGTLTLKAIIQLSKGYITERKVRLWVKETLDPTTGSPAMLFDEKTETVTLAPTGF